MGYNEDDAHPLPEVDFAGVEVRALDVVPLYIRGGRYFYGKPVAHLGR
jgi:hypothetical protein